MFVLGIDVGIINLALVQVEVDDESWEIKRVCACHRVDTTLLCTSRETADRVVATVERFQAVFDTSDVVLIERQPLTGLTGVEEVLFYMFRQKCQKVSPNSMHKFFGINSLDYEARKHKTVSRARPWLRDEPGWIKNPERQHDMADAMCIILWWWEHNRPEGPNVWECYRCIV